jgi:glycosyltransferase involved in cell wall biosynthesis
MTKRVRVAHVTTVDLSLRYLLLNQMRFLQAVGFDVIGVSAPGPHVAALEAAGVRHVPVHMTRAMNPVRDLASVFDLERVFRRERPTIVHTHNPKPGLYGQLAARAAGVPYVVNTIHGFYFHEHMSPLLRRMFILFEQIAAAQSDAILSQNPEDIITAERERITAPGVIELLGNGIDLARFSPDRAAPRAHTRASLGIAPDALVVGFVGRLVAEKGVLELFEAVAALARRDVVLLVIGPLDVDKADALTPNHLRARFPGVRAVFTGMRDDLPDLYGAMDIFALPSWREGYPRSAMEAAAMALPLVVSDVRGCRQVCDHGENGLRVQVRDAAALQAALVSLLADPVLRARMGRAGRALAVQRFDERSVFVAVERTYKRLLAGSSRAPGRRWDP